MGGYRLDGRNPLSYMGVKPSQPPQLLVRNAAPTANDVQNLVIGTLWVVQQKSNPAQDPAVYMLVNQEQNQATWIELFPGSGTGAVESLTGNSGGAVLPTAADPANINILGTGVITVVGNPGTNTLTITPSGALPTSFPTDAGTATPSGGILNVYGGTAGRDINTTGSGNTVRVELNNNISLGDLSVITTGNNAINVVSGNITLAGTGASAAGNINIPATSTDGRQGQITLGATPFLRGQGTNNLFVGPSAGNNTSTGSGNNVAVGYQSLAGLTTGSLNVAVGSQSADSITTGSINIAVGGQALASLTTGSSNICIGDASGSAYASSESNNICIGHSIAGTAAESNVMRIGNPAVQTSTYMAGVYNASLGATHLPVFIDSNNKVGTSTFSADSWTPELQFGGSSAGITYLVREGIYQDLGNLVFYSGGVALTSKGAAAGTATITGLPFNSSGVFTVQFGLASPNNITFGAGYTFIVGINSLGTNSLIFTAGGSGVPQIVLDDTHFANNSQLSVTGFYFRA